MLKRQNNEIKGKEIIIIMIIIIKTITNPELTETIYC